MENKKNQFDLTNITNYETKRQKDSENEPIEKFDKTKFKKKIYNVFKHQFILRDISSFLYKINSFSEFYFLKNFKNLFPNFSAKERAILSRLHNMHVISFYGMENEPIC